MNIEEYENDLITELCGLRPTVFFCTIEISVLQSVYDGFPASSYAICNYVISKMAAYPNNGRRGVISACNIAHSDIVAHFLGWIGRVVHNDI